MLARQDHDLDGLFIVYCQHFVKDIGIREGEGNLVPMFDTNGLALLSQDPAMRGHVRSYGQGILDLENYE